MTPEEERWAEALAILRWKGCKAMAFVAERLSALRDSGDRLGVERFEAIHTKLEAILDASQA